MLALSSGSTIDMGGSGILKFCQQQLALRLLVRMLSVTTWAGSLSGGGTNQLVFGSSSAALTLPQLAEIQFLNPAGLGPNTYGATILSSGEVVPVAIPEPATLVMIASGLLVLAGYGLRRRHSHLRCWR